MARYEIEIPGHPPGPNDRLHWAARHRLTAPLRDAVAWQARALGLPAPLDRARLTVTLLYPTAQLRDIDNAVASVKCLIDGLVVGGLLADDAPRHLELIVRQARGERRCVRLMVEGVG